MGGVSVELVHLGSLYHDDVIDEAPTRRSVESVNARWGNLVAIVAGDFLLARAAEIAAALGTEVAGLLAATIGRLCEGEVAEVRAAFQCPDRGGLLRPSIAGKTASLMAAACRIGALSAAVPRPGGRPDRLRARFGMVFQIVDDILDIIGVRGRAGETAGPGPGRGDIHPPGAARPGRPGRRSRAAAPAGGPLGHPERDKARSIVAASSGIAASVAVGRRYADEAASAAARCPSAALGAGFERLAYSLLDGLPTA